MTTSPGMKRMIEKTITLTRTSVGIASASRRRTYCLISTARPAAPLSLQPGEHQPAPQREAVVVLEALHLRRVRNVLRRRREVHVVRLVREVALDVVDDGQALLRVQLAPLGDEHLVQ